MSGANALAMRPARRDDVPAMVRLLADDALGRERESCDEPLPAFYWRAFDTIVRDERSLLVVAERPDGTVVGCLQVTFIPGLSYRGGERALIEDVRVDASHRGQGIGRRMLEWTIAQARGRGCRLVELFVHETRSEALRFYANLGFSDSHAGMRLVIEDVEGAASPRPR